MKSNQLVLALLTLGIVIFLFLFHVLAQKENVNSIPIKGTFLVADKKPKYFNFSEPILVFVLIDLSSKQTKDFSKRLKVSDFIQIGDTVRIDSIGEIYFLSNRKLKRY